MRDCAVDLQEAQSKMSLNLLGILCLCIRQAGVKKPELNQEARNTLDFGCSVRPTVLAQLMF